jgi:signal transduction histidine kinase/ActR/RegA family two-component response regulator
MNDRLSQAQKRFNLLDRIPIGTCVLQSDLVVLFWNECLEEWSKIQRQKILGQPIYQFFDHFQQPRYLERLQAIFAGGPPAIFSSQLHPHLIPSILPTGKYRVQQTTVTSISGLDNESRYYALFSIQDVTDLTFRVDEYRQIRDRALAEAKERKLAQEEAESANRVKDDFLAIVSHELRTPLNPILGWSQLLRQGNLTGSNLKAASEAIERNAKLQSQLIDDLLDVSRILRGQMSLKSEIIKLPLVIYAALEIVKIAAAEKSIAINLNLDASVGSVRGDTTRLQQVLWNLLTNAIKFTPKGGRIDIILTANDSYIELQVKDTGEGISAEFLPHVFDSFRQANSSITRSIGGLGLGLAICRHLVELHGGQIWADSPGEGQGATFTVQLPVANTEVPTIPPAARFFTPIAHNTANNTTGILENFQILVVDDEPDTCELLTSLLQFHSAKVQAVQSVATAILSLNQTLPDLIISDLGMPQHNGYDLLHYVRSLPAKSGGNIPVIALTAYATGDIEQQALNAGFQKYLTKPTDFDQLLGAIISLVPR